MPRTLLLVDATNLAMRCAYAQGKELIAPAAAAHTACGMVARVGAALGVTHLVGCVDPQPSDVPNIRRALCPEYKAGRDVATAPYSAAVARAFALRGWTAVEAPGYEADDVIATLAEGAVEGWDILIYSRDSDVEGLARPATDMHGSVTIVRPMPAQHPGGPWALLTAADVCREHGIADPMFLGDLKALAGEPGDNVASWAGRTPSGAVSCQLAIARKLLAMYGTLEGVLGAAGRAPEDRVLARVWAGRDAVLRAAAVVALRTEAPVDPALLYDLLAVAFDGAREAAHA